MSTEPLPCGFTHAFLSERFGYDEDFGMLYRKITVSHNGKAGKYVGTTDGKGYLHVNILNKFVRVHRIIFFLHTRQAPPEVDHIDGCRQNNLIENLRGATRQQNAGNARLNANNTTGYKGVSRNARTGYYHAQLKIDGKQTYLGRAHDPIIAAEIYNAAAIAHFGTFAKVNNA